MPEKQYLKFNYEPSPSGKTLIGKVVNEFTGEPIGMLKWYGPWRKYIFDPFATIIFDAGCLKQIAHELDHLMEQRKEKV